MHGAPNVHPSAGRVTGQSQEERGCSRSMGGHVTVTSERRSGAGGLGGTAPLRSGRWGKGYDAKGCGLLQHQLKT